MEENLDAAVRLFATLPGAARMRVGEVEATLTTIPVGMFNAVVGPRFPADAIDEGIAEIAAAARGRGVPMSWHITPRSTPVNLGERLLSAGFRRGPDVPAMAARLDGLAPAPLPSGCAIAHVTPDDHEATIAAWIEGFDMPDWLADPLRQLIALDDPDAIWHGIAYLDGAPVSAGSVLYAGGVAGLFNIATIPSARGQGIGGAVTTALMLDARERGYRTAVLQSSDVGLPVYRRLGFEQVCSIAMYELSI
jgi:GNAT superfamily N-acetyltransferase